MTKIMKYHVTEYAKTIESLTFEISMDSIGDMEFDVYLSEEDQKSNKHPWYDLRLHIHNYQIKDFIRTLFHLSSVKIPAENYHVKCYSELIDGEFHLNNNSELLVNLSREGTTDLIKFLK